MQLKKVLILILSVVLCYNGFSQHIDSLVAQGNKQYSDGNYEEAVQTWEGLTE